MHTDHAASAAVPLGGRTLNSWDDLEQFVREFEAHNLPGEEWNHPGHLAAGLWYVATYPESERLDRMREAIRSYNVALGGENSDHDGYHETITRFYLWYIGEHFRRMAEDPSMETLLALLTGPAAHREFPLRFYSREQLFSIAARRAWVEPDLHPLRFD